MPPRTAVATALALLGFAANSLLCRAAIRDGHVDPATFTAVRLASGAVALGILARSWRGGEWVGAGSLWVYAALFSFAYASLGAATGALLLFAAVQLTLLAAGWWSGERLGAVQAAGWVASAGGVLWLVAPGLTAPDPVGAGLMIGAGAAWGLYTLRGRRSADPLASTAGNFLRAAPLGLLSFAPFAGSAHADRTGLGLAVVSGVVTSGVGYSLWYAAVPALGALRAAVLQLTVPILAAVGAVVILGESPSPRLAVAAGLVLGGAAVALHGRR